MCRVQSAHDDVKSARLRYNSVECVECVEDASGFAHRSRAIAYYRRLCEKRKGKEQKVVVMEATTSSGKTHHPPVAPAQLSKPNRANMQI